MKMAADLGDRAPEPSALSNLLNDASAKRSSDALPLEVLHNLQHQHEWKDLRVETLSAVSISSLPTLDLTRTMSPSRSLSRPSVGKLLTGIPPRHIYVHPDFQAHLVKNDMRVDDFPIQREWILPMSIGEKWTLRMFCEVFDLLPPRSLLLGANGVQHRDAKRLLLAMMSHNGMGGDGTIAYYIMQEGDVKPRQN